MRSKYFKVHEFVPRAIYDKYGERSWRYVDERLILTMDTIKERFNLGTIQINNYYWGGDREWSGIRLPASSDYSFGSMHSYANALDFVLSHYTAEEVRQDIINNPHLYPHVKGLELEVEWVHLDIRNERYLITFKVPKE